MSALAKSVKVCYILLKSILTKMILIKMNFVRGAADVCCKRERIEGVKRCV